jgi:hypothetical protein
MASAADASDGWPCMEAGALPAYARDIKEQVAMETTTISMEQAARYELRFQSLYHEGRALSFPCDMHGRVHLDGLSDRARHNYLFARAVVGREFATPAVLRSDLH